MPTSRTRSILQTALASITIVAIAVGIPVLLVAIGGWPLPRSVPSLSGVATRLRQGDIPADAVIKTLVVVAWLIWLQVMWSLVWEVVVNVRRVGERRPPKPAPLAIPAISSGMARLVAMVFSASLIVVSMPSVALAMPAPSPMQLGVPTARVTESAVRTADATVTASEPTWLVWERDSLWRIAEQALGDGSRSSEIIDLNSNLRSPRDVHAGQRLRLPADAVIPADRLPVPLTTTHTDVGAAKQLPEETVMIQPGDTLWDLARARLQLVDPEGPGDGEILAYVNRVIERNADIVEDPNLIFPGELFTMPAIGEPLDVEPSPTTANPTPVDPEPAAAAEGAEPVRPATDQAVDRSPTSAPASQTELPPPMARSADGAGVNVFEPVSVGSNSANDNGLLSQLAFGLAGSTVLASGLLLAMRRRRAAHASRGAAAYRSGSRPQPIESAIVVAADVPLLLWARHELTDLFADPGFSGVRGTPVAVEMSESTGIELLWSEPNRTAPRPWEAAADGWTWRATYDPNLPTFDHPAPSPLPGLVSVGERDGRQLLVNLEALGTLSVTGDEQAVDDLVRSLIVELSTDDVLADTYVHLVNACGEELPMSSRLLHRTMADAVELATHVVAEHEDLLGSSGASTTFELRCGGEASGREMTVLVVDYESLEDGDIIRRIVCPDRGIALVTKGGSVDGPSITVQADGSAVLMPLSLHFKASALPAATSAAVAELLDEEMHDADVDRLVAEASEEPADGSPIAIVNDILGLVGNQPADGDGATTRPAPPEVMVMVLGSPIVPNFPSLGRMDTNLLTFLACNGGEASEEQLIDAVWNGRMVERVTVWNRISKTRSIIGQHLPAREPGSNRVRLAASVRTDFAYFDELVSYADDGSSDEAIELLVEALDLIKGPPFDAAGYDWAHQHQHHARACELIESTAIRLVDLALDAGDLEAARHGIVQSLRALPVNEPLYRSRMRIEAAADNPSGVCRAFDELSQLLAELSDDGFDFEPSIRTVRLRSDLLAGTRNERSA